MNQLYSIQAVPALGPVTTSTRRDAPVRTEIRSAVNDFVRQFEFGKRFTHRLEVAKDEVSGLYFLQFSVLFIGQS